MPIPENLLPDVDPSKVEGIKLDKGMVSTRVLNALLRQGNKDYKTGKITGVWHDYGEPIDLGVLAEHSAEEIQALTRNLGPKGIQELKEAISKVARKS